MPSKEGGGDWGGKAAEQEEGEQYSLQFPRAEGTRNVVGERERASHKIW